MLKICFVCTGNTCRSVMAERLMKKTIKSLGLSNIQVCSKGIYANGEMITENAKKTLKKLKASSANRKSVKLRKIDKATLYVAMTEAHKAKIDSKKVISFKSLLGYEIEDPYGLDEDIYMKTAKDIQKGIEILLSKINMWRDL